MLIIKFLKFLPHNPAKNNLAFISFSTSFLYITDNKKQKEDEMKEKRILFIIAILILALSFFCIPNPELTGFTVSEATKSPLSISLDNTKIAINAPIKGTLFLELSENIKPTETITIATATKSYSYTIEEILKKANYSIEYESSELNGTNEATIKTLSFSNAASQFLSLKIPRYAEVSDVSFTIEAITSPTALSMDFGNEGTIDWYYLGSFLAYNTTKIFSEDFDNTKEGTGYIKGNTYYCEFLNLPRTKHLTIAANYTKLSTEGDLQALALSVPTGNPKIGWTGGSDSCDLPESGTTKSCVIEMEHIIEGEYLICIFASGDYDAGKTLYEIPLDNSQETDTAYTCPQEENSICTETNFNNFFISAQAGRYNNTLPKTITAQDWETFTDAVLTGIKYYVGSSPYNGLCKTNTCTVPINISVESAGIITFKDLSLIYEYNDITQGSNIFYDVSIPDTDITAIEDQILKEGATIEIPLELFEWKEETRGDYLLEISFLSSTTNAALSIKDASEILSATTLIQTATETFDTFLEETTEEYSILLMLDKISTIEQTQKDIGEYKNKIGFTEESLLVEEIEKTLSEIPWKLTTSQTKSETTELKITDIPETLGDQKEILSMQDAITVKTTLKTITITKYNEEETSYILIKKEITANKDIEAATLYEQSPISFNELLYSEKPESTTGTQAEYIINLKEGETKELYYLTTEAVSLSDFQSILILSETEEASTCGNFVCERTEDTESCPADCEEEKESLSLWYIIIPLAIIIFLALLFFLRKKISKPKESTANDPLVNFFKRGFAKGLKKEQLIETLRKKGWKDVDIQAAVKRI